MAIQNIVFENFVSDDEAREFIKLAKQGNSIALKSIIDKNHLMLSKYAQKFSRRGSCFDDLYSVGKIALIEQVNKFDFENKTTVGTIFITAVLTAMKRYVDADRNVRIAINASEKKRKLHAIIERLKSEGKEINIDVVSKMANMPIKTVQSLISIDLGTVSMNIRAEGKEGEGDEFGDSIVSDTVTPYEEIERNDTIQFMLKVLNNLSEIEQIVIEYRYGLKNKKMKTYEELAKMLNRSIEGIRQIEHKAKLKLKQMVIK